MKADDFTAKTGQLAYHIAFCVEMAGIHRLNIHTWFLGFHIKPSITIGFPTTIGLLLSLLLLLLFFICIYIYILYPYYWMSIIEQWWHIFKPSFMACVFFPPPRSRRRNEEKFHRRREWRWGAPPIHYCMGLTFWSDDPKQVYGLLAEHWRILSTWFFLLVK